MTPPIRTLLARPASLLLVGLVMLFASLTPVHSDIGRGGGIVILPCAKPITEWGKYNQVIQVFPAGQDIVLQLAPGVSNVTVVLDDGRGNVSTGSLAGAMFALRAAELARLASSGVTRFDVYLIDPNRYGYHLEMRTVETGDVEVELH